MNTSHPWLRGFGPAALVQQLMCNRGACCQFEISLLFRDKSATVGEYDACHRFEL